MRSENTTKTSEQDAREAFGREVEKFEINTPADIRTPAIIGLVVLALGFAAIFWAASV